jgi:hypothetical protein
MKRKMVVFATMTLAACTDASLPSAPARPTQASTSASMTTSHIDINQVVVFAVPMGCTGEPVQWTQHSTGDFRYVLDAAGGVRGTVTGRDQGSYGVGLVTGTMYRLQTIEALVSEFSADALPAEETGIFQRRFISAGSMPNFRVNRRFHFTVNANGSVTSYFEELERICD